MGRTAADIDLIAAIDSRVDAYYAAREQTAAARPRYACRHCKRPGKSAKMAGRGLCWSCWNNADIRNLYPKRKSRRTQNLDTYCSKCGALRVGNGGHKCMECVQAEIRAAFPGLAGKTLPDDGRPLLPLPDARSYAWSEPRRCEHGKWDGECPRCEAEERAAIEAQGVVV